MSGLDGRVALRAPHEAARAIGLTAAEFMADARPNLRVVKLGRVEVVAVDELRRLVAGADPREPLAVSSRVAARLLDVSPDTFRRHVRAEVEQVEVGRWTRFPLHGLRRWVERASAAPLRDDPGGGG